MSQACRRQAWLRVLLGSPAPAFRARSSPKRHDASSCRRAVAGADPAALPVAPGLGVALATGARSKKAPALVRDSIAGTYWVRDEQCARRAGARQRYGWALVTRRTPLLGIWARRSRTLRGSRT